MENRNEALLENNAGLDKRIRTAEELLTEAFADKLSLEMQLSSAEEAATRAAQLSFEAAEAQAAAIEGLQLLERNASGKAFEEFGNSEPRVTQLVARYELHTRRQHTDTFSPFELHAELKAE